MDGTEGVKAGTTHEEAAQSGPRAGEQSESETLMRARLPSSTVTPPTTSKVSRRETPTPPESAYFTWICTYKDRHRSTPLSANQPSILSLLYISQSLRVAPLTAVSHNIRF